MKVAVVGTGYVGLVTGTCFAEAGNDVLCVDNNQEKLRKLRDGQVPIYEPGLENLFERNTKEGRLNFTDSLADAVKFADIIFLALPNPPPKTLIFRFETSKRYIKYISLFIKNTPKLI